MLYWKLRYYNFTKKLDVTRTHRVTERGPRDMHSPILTLVELPHAYDLDLDVVHVDTTGLGTP